MTKTLRLLKFREYSENRINQNELKEVLLRYYYSEVYKRNPEIFTSDMERELIITEVKGSYGNVSSIVFSVNGSPPKGEAILFLHGEDENYWIGSLVVIGNGIVSKRVNLVKILKNLDLREFYDMDYIIKKNVDEADGEKSPSLK